MICSKSYWVVDTMHLKSSTSVDECTVTDNQAQTKWTFIYSKTCLQWPPLGQNKLGHSRDVVCLDRNDLLSKLLWPQRSQVKWWRYQTKHGEYDTLSCK